MAAHVLRLGNEMIIRRPRAVEGIRRHSLPKLYIRGIAELTGLGQFETHERDHVYRSPDQFRQKINTPTTERVVGAQERTRTSTVLPAAT